MHIPRDERNRDTHCAFRTQLEVADGIDLLALILGWTRSTTIHRVTKFNFIIHCLSGSPFDPPPAEQELWVRQLVGAFKQVRERNNLREAA